MFGGISGINKTNGNSVTEWIKFIGGNGEGIRGAICSDSRGVRGQLKWGSLGKASWREEWVSVTKFQECRMMTLEVMQPFRVVKM